MICNSSKYNIFALTDFNKNRVFYRNCMLQLNQILKKLTEGNARKFSQFCRIAILLTLSWYVLNVVEQKSVLDIIAKTVIATPNKRSNTLSTLSRVYNIGRVGKSAKCADCK